MKTHICHAFAFQKRRIAAINRQGGVYMFGNFLPIWAVVLIEFCFATTLEMVMGSPCSFRLAMKCFDPKTTHPVIFESAIICATVALMCPVMSFIAAFLYYPYYEGFSIIHLLANWLKLVCFNFPFAFFTQLFLSSHLSERFSRHFSEEKTEKRQCSFFLHFLNRTIIITHCKLQKISMSSKLRKSD